MSPSSDHEDEYEVESILAARVAKKGKKRFWEFNVKWQGYNDPAENTWEPIEAFFDKDMVANFWSRVNTGGRDIDDLSLFEKDEQFIPKGPPRRKPKAKTTNKSASTVLHTTENPTEKPKATNVQEPKASSSISAPVPRKRVREEPSRASPKPTKKTKLENGPSVSSVNPKSRSKSIETQSEVPPSEASEQEMDVYSAPMKPSKPTKKPPRNDVSKETIKFGKPKGRPKPEPVKPVSPPPSKKPGPGRKVITVLDSSEEEEILPTPQTPSLTPEVVETSKEKDITQELPEKLPRATTHRERAKKPRVALINDAISPASAGTGVKSRILNRFGVADKDKDPKSRSEETNANQRISKNKSSLLTAVKGKALVQKGKYAPEPPPARAKSPPETTQANTEAEDPELWGTGVAWEPTGLLGQILATENDQDVDMAAPEDPPRHPSEELRSMAAATAAEGEDLPDFEEDEGNQAGDDPVTIEQEQPQQLDGQQEQQEETTTTEKPVEEVEATESISTPVSKPSFVQNTLFANVTDQSSASTGPFNHRTTIFDNAYGSGHSFVRSASVSIESPTYTIFTGSNKSFPVALDEVASSPNAMGPTLEAVIKQTTSRIPGKFYSGDTAMRVLRILRPSGHAANVVPAVGATKDQIDAFGDFLESLEGLRLFIAMAGQSVLAYCLSNTYFASQLNFPSSIANLNETEEPRVVVCRVSIEDPNVYAGLIDLAE